MQHQYYLTLIWTYTHTYTYTYKDKGDESNICRCARYLNKVMIKAHCTPLYGKLHRNSSSVSHSHTSVHFSFWTDCTDVSQYACC